jgi:(3,5-dihydroxyphenyl)acetyl-CoA 1,2-dioxygenase
VLRACGLDDSAVDAWAGADPTRFLPGAFDDDVRSLMAYAGRGARLFAALPPRVVRNEREQAAAMAIATALGEARGWFLRTHAQTLYDEVTDGGHEAVRVDELLARVAQRVPGLAPDPQALAAERARPLAEQDGVEAAQGQVLAHVLSSPRAGAHLVWAMLRPTAPALAHLDEFVATGVADLGLVHVRRDGRAGVVELRNPRHLNAEDDETLALTELAVDLVLLHPDIEVGVFRGGVVEHPRYAGRRIFGAGLNLTRLYLGRIPYLFFIDRDMGYVNKLYRGLSHAEHRPGEPEDTLEKPWIAAVETYAIGGGCQLLHVMDHVIAERGARLFLPARKEGIIPGASNLRLARAVGDRVARRAILSGKEFVAGEPDGDLLCDEIVEPGEMDAAIARRAELLTSSGLINAAANRRVMRVGQEPLDVFRTYMAAFAREQVALQQSPALLANLEQHWNASERRL